MINNLQVQGKFSLRDPGGTLSERRRRRSEFGFRGEKTFLEILRDFSETGPATAKLYAGFKESGFRGTTAPSDWSRVKKYPD